MPNDTAEAYTGYNIGHKEARNFLKFDTAPIKILAKTVKMQMAMGSMSQKPTQRERFGEFSEGLPGSTLERGMC